MLAAFVIGCGFWIYEAIVFILMLMVGIVSTTANVAAMDAGRDNAGVASALLGAIGQSFGGIIPVIIGLGNIFTMTGVMFVLCAILTSGCVVYFRKSDKIQSQI